jgi:hypothetical protein
MEWLVPYELEECEIELGTRTRTWPRTANAWRALVQALRACFRREQAAR